MKPELTMSMVANKDDLIRLQREEIARLRKVLQQFADNKLTDENCASVEVASRRIRGIARAALGHD